MSHRLPPSLRVIALVLALITAIGCKARSSLSGSTESGVAGADDSTPTPASPVDYRSVAEKVVGQSAGVQDGDLVLISGSDEDLPLLEDIAVEVRKRGGSPLVTVASQRLGRRL